MQHQHNTVLGWDVGGAHLKAALLDAHGVALQVIQVACPLWQGLDQLHAAISEVLDRLEANPNKHFITMTGELADIFPDRATGVYQIAQLMVARLGPDILFYAGAEGFLSTALVERHASAIASANWLASASWASSKCHNALFLDIGSTTIDIVPIIAGQPCHRGATDASRMQSDELVYSGVVRTPVMSLGPLVPFAGEWHSLAAEHFATTADVYRLTEDLDEADDMAAAADGGGKKPEDSARRLARMIGLDVDEAPLAAWAGLAQAIKQQQIARLKQAVLRTLSRYPEQSDLPIIGAGVGRFLAQELARQLNHPYHDVSELMAAQDESVCRWAASCLPAYAVACLGFNADQEEMTA